MRTLDYALIALWLYAAATLAGGGGVLPDVRPVDSPFPADGEPWLLLTANAKELSGELVLAQTSVLREAVPTNRRVLDYGATDELTEPWSAALAWAKQEGGGSAYFVFRDGSRAAEGRLEGSLQDRLDAITRAMGLQ
ncbi:MAG: hypothetical protein AAF805_14865 [Planctomycetota bacterium]